MFLKASEISNKIGLINTFIEKFVKLMCTCILLHIRHLETKCLRSKNSARIRYHDPDPGRSGSATIILSVQEPVLRILDFSSGFWIRIFPSGILDPGSKRSRIPDPDPRQRL
jgi:hypothetical protein